MEFEELKKYIIEGRDVEFQYEGKEYSITNSNCGFLFSEKGIENTQQIYENAEYLISKLLIKGNKIESISKKFTDIEIY